MKSGCTKTAYFSLKSTSILNATIVLRILEIKTRTLPRSKKESHSGTDFRLFYLIAVLFVTNLLFYVVLYVQQFLPRVYLRRPFVDLCNSYCSQ
jgi:hypothetical protein